MKAFPIIIAVGIVVNLTGTTIGFAQNEASQEKEYKSKEILADFGGQTLKFTVLSPEESRKLKYMPIPLDTTQIDIGGSWDCLPPSDLHPVGLCRPKIVFCVDSECVEVGGLASRSEFDIGIK